MTTTGILQRARGFDQRHPLWWDAVLPLGLMILSALVTRRLDPFTIAFVVVINASVAFRRRYPFPAMVVATVGIVTAVTAVLLADLDAPWAYLALWVLLFNVGLRRGGGRRMSGVVVVIALVSLAAFAAPLAATTTDIWGRIGSAAPVFAMCLATILAGAQIRSHRAALVSQHREAARIAVTAERSRIAQEMHDIIGHNLSVITSLSNGGAVAARTSASDAERAFEAIGQVSRSATQEVRRVLAVLREDQSPQGASLSPQPTVKDISALVESVRTAGIAVRLERTGDLDSLSDGRQLAIYRIVQESLTNILRHGGKHARALVAIKRAHDELLLQIDSTGPAAAEAGLRSETENGHGIAGMRRRVEAHGGTLKAHATSSGWRVHARMPLEQEER